MNRPVFYKCISLFMLLVFAGAGCSGPSQAEILATEPVTLSVWRVFDNDDSLQQIIANYRQLHPNVSFEYRELRIDEYEDELLRAFAEGNGPDIFSLHNTWLGEYENLILPLPDTVTIPYSEVRGTIKKETVVTVQEERTITERGIEDAYIDVVADDVVRTIEHGRRQDATREIMGLPLAVDTLVLYYNRDLLNAAGIPEPPATWSAFQEAVTTMTRVSNSDAILQSAAALGTSRNVERAFDILSVLMMQNGTQMVDPRGAASFAKQEENDVIPGADAVRFYTDFANPSKQVYTWNEDQTDSFEAFTLGKTAFFLGYSYHNALIKTRAPKLNFSIAPLPQIEGGRTVHYANYWVETVAKATEHGDWAWDFVEFATSPSQVTSYLSATQKPTALRGLINTQVDDDNLSVFAKQLLTAQSWYRGNDAEVAEESLLDLIDKTLAGEDLRSAIIQAQNKVNQTY